MAEHVDSNSLVHTDTSAPSMRMHAFSRRTEQGHACYHCGLSLVDFIQAPIKPPCVASADA